MAFSPPRFGEGRGRGSWRIIQPSCERITLMRSVRSRQPGRGLPMRRLVFTVFGGLELALAAVLVMILVHVPRTPEVEKGFDRAEQVTRSAEKEIQSLRRQVADLRRPELERVAVRLRRQTRTVKEMLEGQRIDFANVEAITRSLDALSAGLDGWSETLDPDRMGRVGQALTLTADQLDRQVAASAK